MAVSVVKSSHCGGSCISNAVYLASEDRMVSRKGKEREGTVVITSSSLQALSPDPTVQRSHVMTPRTDVAPAKLEAVVAQDLEPKGSNESSVNTSTETPVGKRVVCITPPIPQGTTPLSHQVAGHVFGRENGQRCNKHGFLQSQDGAVLKPVQGSGKGERELQFYQEVFSDGCDCQALITLRQFIPRFIGVWTTPEHPGVKYVKLIDLTKKFLKPCIMDAKIGPVTYDRDADEEKIRREKNKFPALDKVGFQVVGIKVFNIETNSYKSLERTFLRALNETTILTDGLAAYFEPVAPLLRKHLIAAFLRRIDAIENWFESQRSLHFIASSLLFVYDGAVFISDETRNPSCSCADASLSSCTCATSTSVSRTDVYYDSCVELRLIDFTHVFASPELDNNYLIGLRSLRNYLTQLLV